MVESLRSIFFEKSVTSFCSSGESLDSSRCVDGGLLSRLCKLRRRRDIFLGGTGFKVSSGISACGYGGKIDRVGVEIVVLGHFYLFIGLYVGCYWCY